MELVSQFAVGGGVYALAFLEEEGKLVATVNSRVSLAEAHRSVRRACLRLTIFFFFFFSVSRQVLLLDISPDHQLSKSAVWGSAYMPATLAPLGGNKLLVGDAMSSMSVVEVGEKSLRTVAKVSSFSSFPFLAR